MIALAWLACSSDSLRPEPVSRFGALPAFQGEQAATEPFEGVRIVEQRQAGDDPQARWAVLVDPFAEGISFTTSPDNGDAPGETTRQTGLEFLASENVQLAVNAHFFSPWPAEPTAPVDLAGLAIADGTVVSTFEPGFEVAFAIARDGRAAVVEALDPAARDAASTAPFEVDDAVGAAEIILADGVNVGTWKERHPRTAIGVTTDGLVVFGIVDGRQPGVAEGLTTPELADWLASFGVTDAINLDGGGSTTLAIDDGEPRILNVPVGYVVPGSLRHNGSFIGVRVSSGTP